MFLYRLYQEDFSPLVMFWNTEHWNVDKRIQTVWKRGEGSHLYKSPEPKPQQLEMVEGIICLQYGTTSLRRGWQQTGRGGVGASFPSLHITSPITMAQRETDEAERGQWKLFCKWYFILWYLSLMYCTYIHIAPIQMHSRNLVHTTCKK